MLDNSQNKLICVFGLGQSGLSAARYLQRMNKQFFVVDSRENPPGKDDIAGLANCVSHSFGFIPAEQLKNASFIILSPGVSPGLKELRHAQDAGVKIIGDIELFAQQTQQKIVAITGSNGKSTVTDLTHQLFLASGINAKIGGNFGVPVLDYLPQDDADVYILELSSFQLDTTYSLNAEVSVVLNVTEDHMDRYLTFNDYVNSKLSIYKGAKNIIANADDEFTLSSEKGGAVLFSLKKQFAHYHTETTGQKTQLVCRGKKLVDVNELALTGKHNWCNALAALAILETFGLKLTDKIMSVLKSYQGLMHRYQLVLRKNNIDWINDSKATNVGATQAALQSIETTHYTQVVLIAGGDAKGADLSPLKPLLADKVSHLILLGKDAPLFAPLFPAEKTVFVKDMKQAVIEANNYLESQLNSSCAQSNRMVLLSPACASLDMYKNFEVRGQAFVDAVKECA